MTATTLIDKLKPYVDSILPVRPVGEDTEDILKTFASLTGQPYDDIEVTPENLRKRTIETVCHTIYGSWSEALRWAYEEHHQPVQLSDSLQPPLTKEDQEYWDDAVRQCGLSSEQVEGILREFGKNELVEGAKLDLSWDGYIIKSDSGYELRKNE